MNMKPSSASALIWFAVILLVVGMMIMSPSGAFLVFLLALLFSAIPAIFSRKKIRIAAIVLLIISVLLAANQYPKFKEESNLMEKRIKTKKIGQTDSPGYPSFETCKSIMTEKIT